MLETKYVRQQERVKLHGCKCVRVKNRVEGLGEEYVRRTAKIFVNGAQQAKT